MDAAEKALRLETPLSREQARSLRAGQRVLLSGVVYTARDAAHRRILEELGLGRELPFPLEGQTLYYVGPAPARPGEVIGPAGPTTASRMDPFTLPLLERGVRALIGKGSRAPEVRRALAEYGVVYLVAVGGAAAVLARRIRAAEVVAYEELGTEAVRRLEVHELPLVVGNDVHGGDVFEQGRLAYRKKEPGT